MTIYILDTDHLSLYGRSHPAILQKMEETNAALITTAITAEEQLRGRLAQVSAARNETQRGMAYQWLTQTIAFLSMCQIFPYDAQAQGICQTLKTQRLHIGTQDLRIAAIALAHNAILLTRNRRDFEKVTGIAIADWSL